MGEEHLNYIVVQMPEFAISGVSVRTTNERMQSIVDIEGAWEAFFTKYNIKNKKIVGLYTDYDADYLKPYTFYAGYVTQENIFDRKVQEGKFAKFTGEGDMSEVVPKLWQKIWNTPLERTYISDYEVYFPSIVEGVSEQKVEIYIGIK